MAVTDWSPHYKRLLALSAQGLSQQGIANVLTEETGEEFTRDMVRHALSRAQQEVRSLVDMPKPDRIPYVTKYMDYILGEHKPEPKDWELKTKILNKSRAKLLVQSDLHVPFHDESLINDSINRNLDADAYVGVADIMDCYAHSVFDKNIDLPFIFEIDETLRILEYLSETFELVLLLEANHEARVKKTIQKMLPESLQFLAEQHILKRLASPFPNVIVFHDYWFFQFGSVIYTHPEKASQVELRAAMSVYEHFKEWGEMYKLSPWNCVIVSHTHQAGISYPAHAKVMEIGCLSKPMQYTFNPKIPYKHPHSAGYAVITMNHGIADLNECREYKFFNSQSYL